MRDEIQVTGGWLGSYRYAGLEAMRRPVRFEATFRQVGIAGAQLDGEILDDCALGSAALVGYQAGSIVRFTKQYRRTTVIEQTGRVDYAGIMSDDGSVIRGTWQLKAWAHGVLLVRAHGTWDARRQWRDESALCDETSSADRSVSVADW